jgi:fucose permease
MVMTSQQVGASLGTALLSTVAGTVAAHSDAVHGFNVASLGAAGFLCVAAVAVYWVLSERSPDHSRWKLPSRSTRL